MRDKGILFKHESASARLQDVSGVIMLCHVYSRERRQGHATGLMEKVCRYADENEIRLHLRASPYKTTRQSDIPNQQKLEEFYRRFGFITDYRMPAGWMVRPVLFKGKNVG
jgi:GNAT superfamily N-acetyltransferase